MSYQTTTYETYGPGVNGEYRETTITSVEPHHSKHNHDTLKGAAGGAAIGSVVPGIGTVVGAAVGAAIGYHEKHKHSVHGTQY